MSDIMDEYFENLVQQLRTGKLSSGELIQKIDKSELVGLNPKGHVLSPRAASIPEIKDDPSFEELCQQAEILLNNAPIRQNSKTLHFDLSNTPSGPNKFQYEPTFENTQHITSRRSPSFIKNPFLHLTRDPLEEIGNINVQSDKLFECLGKKQFDDEQIEKIRARTTQKRLEKALLLKQQSLMKEVVEFETHCKFQPQVNSEKNRGIKSKYLATSAQKSPSHKSNNENFTFRPQTTEYKAKSKTKQYLDRNAFSRLSSTSTACQLSTRFASQVTLPSDALFQHKKSTSPTASTHLVISTMRAESLQKLSKIPSTLNFSPKENALLTSDRANNDEIFEKLESIKASPLHCAHTRGNTFENEFETKENLNYKENEQITCATKNNLHKENQEFLERQEAFESTRRDRISKITQRIAASHNPQIEAESKKILRKKFGGSVNFEKRSQYFETQKKLKLESLKKSHSPTFHPEISEYARSLSKEKVQEVRMNSLRKTELSAKNIRTQKNMKECSELIFHPEINTNFVTESRLGLQKNLTDYVQDLRSKDQLSKNFKEFVDQRRQIQETIECTHQPQINEFPYYLAKQKELFEPQLKNKVHLIDDKYAGIQKRTRTAGTKISARAETIAEKLFESENDRTMDGSQEKVESSKRTLIAKSGGKCGDHTLTLTSEDLFSGSYRTIGDDEDARSRNIVEEVVTKSDLDRLQISEVLSPHIVKSDRKLSEIEHSPLKPFNEEGCMLSPRLLEKDASFFSFPASPTHGLDSGRKPPLPSGWRKK